ncbi:MAG: LacI family DNA-binding transcriptional regulator [Lentisphaerae bacterium]|nr:LacI family DNA-binding transcriptional regulator [Lentisphaerota bacterium]
MVAREPEAQGGSVTLGVVAEQAGVSRATASRALNGSTLLSTETRKRVVRVAADLGYVPDPRFRLMGQRNRRRQNRVGNLGIILDAFSESTLTTGPYHGRLFWSIEREVRRQGRRLVVTTIQPDRDEYLPEVIADLHVDAVFIVTQQDLKLIERIQHMVPVVLVNALTDAAGVSCLMPDQASGVRQALDHLRDLGHEKIFFFDIADYGQPGQRCLHHVLSHEAFDACIADPARPLPDSRALVLPGRDKPMKTVMRELLQQWRDGDDMPSALLCACDIYALAALEAARELGIAVPRELSVIGCDDLLPCEYVRPRLTSIRQPFEIMGRTAVQTLLGALEHPRAPRTVQTFDVELVPRESCARPAVNTSKQDGTRRM